jgi:CD109 antigen
MVGLKYLMTINQVSSDDKPKVVQFIEEGYNVIMERRNADGSFRYKSKSEMDSVWLTALVVKCLGQVEHLISINETVIEDALEFIKRKQTVSGSIIDDKKDITAFAVISILENSKHFKTYKNMTDKALAYIEQNINKTTNNYDIAIASYAFSLANHSSKSSILNNLKDGERKIVDDANKIYWEVDKDENIESTSDNIKEKMKIASYALLAYLKNEKEFEALSIMRWITSQEQKFFSFLVIQALTEISKVFFSSPLNMNLSVANWTKHIDNTNDLKSLKFELPSKRSLTIDANGSGFALLEVSYEYEIDIDKVKDAFGLTIELLPTNDEKRLYFMICVNVKDEEEKEESIMEVEFTPGYVYDRMSTESLILNGVKVSFIQIF